MKRPLFPGPHCSRQRRRVFPAGSGNFTVPYSMIAGLGSSTQWQPRRRAAQERPYVVGEIREETLQDRDPLLGIIASAGGGKERAVKRVRQRLFRARGCQAAKRYRDCLGGKPRLRAAMDGLIVHFASNDGPQCFVHILSGGHCVYIHHLMPWGQKVGELKVNSAPTI